MQKRAIIRFLATVAGTLSFIIAPSVFADAALNVKTESAADGTITATVSLDGDMTASGVQFALSYDSDKLTIDPNGTQEGALEGSYTINDTESGSVRLVWFNTDGQAVNGSSEILKLKFTPKSNGDTNISFNNSIQAMVVDKELNNINTATNPASLTVTGASSSYSTSSEQTSSSQISQAYFATPTPQAYYEQTPSPTITPPPLSNAGKSPAPSDEPASQKEQEDTANIAPDTSQASKEIVEGYEAPTLASPTQKRTPTPTAQPKDVSPTEIEVISKEESSNTTAITMVIICACLVLAVGAFVVWRRNKP